MERTEYVRRIAVLGLSGQEVPDIGWNGDFVPADPTAEPLHPDWAETADYGGGAYSPDGKFHSGCRNQYCMAPCAYCERNIAVQIRGVTRT